MGDTDNEMASIQGVQDAGQACFVGGMADYVEADMKAKVEVHVELVENGMIAKWTEPVKKKVQIHMGRPMGDPMSVMVLQGIVEGLKSATTKDEKTSDKLAGIIEGFQKTLTKIKSMQEEERYVLEWKSAVCKDMKDLAGIIEKAQSAKKNVEELQKAGHKVWPAAYGEMGDTIYGGAISPIQQAL